MILLIGDYSSVHYELSKALKDKGYSVILISDGDAYKKIKFDVSAPVLKSYNNKLINRLANIFRFFGFFGVKNYLNIKKSIDEINNIEVVQLINPVAISSLGALGNLLLIKYLRKRSTCLSLCALGDDYKWVSACLNKKYKYSALDSVKGNGLRGKFSRVYSLKYIYSPLYFLLDWYTRKKVNIIIPGLLDYKLAHDDDEKTTGIINLPLSELGFRQPVKSKYPLRIFHAWQKGKDLRKGNDVLDKMIYRYISEYGNSKIEYEIVSGVTYDEYLKKYIDSDIILDQIYSYDCGVTGALGMAGGKVVFSGFEIGHFERGINATPDEDELYKNFVKIIDSIELVDLIKNNAYEYADRNHRASSVAEQYLNFWRVTNKY